jgi:glucose/arabinose dehydrogenase
VGGNNDDTAYEEVDFGAAGRNYGWPDCESAPAATRPIRPLSTPARTSGREVSITGGYVCHTIQFPAVYQGSYFFADSTQNWIERLTCDAQGNRPCGDIVCPAEGPDARSTTSISATWTWAASSV